MGLRVDHISGGSGACGFGLWVGNVVCWGSGPGAGVGGPAGILLRLFQLSCFTLDISCHSGGLLGFDIMTTAELFVVNGLRGVDSSSVSTECDWNPGWMGGR